MHLSLRRQAVLVRQAPWCDLEQTICHCSSRVSSLSDHDLFWFQCHRLVECPDVWTLEHLRSTGFKEVIRKQKTLPDGLDQAAFAVQVHACHKEAAIFESLCCHSLAVQVHVMN